MFLHAKVVFKAVFNHISAMILKGNYISGGFSCCVALHVQVVF